VGREKITIMPFPVHHEKKPEIPLICHEIFLGNKSDFKIYLDKQKLRSYIAKPVKTKRY